MSIYKTDPKYKWAALFILIMAGLALWASPEGWPYIIGSVAMIGLIAYIFRNNP